MGVDIDLPVRVGELLHLGRRNRIRGGTGSEIKIGPTHRQGRSGIELTDPQLGNPLHLATPAEILHQEQGQSIAAGRIHRRYGEAMAIGEHQMAVQPGA